MAARARAGARGVIRGPRVAVLHLARAVRGSFYVRLKAAGLTFAQRETALASDKLNGTTWVITGTLKACGL